MSWSHPTCKPQTTQDTQTQVTNNNIKQTWEVKPAAKSEGKIWGKSVVTTPF